MTHFRLDTPKLSDESRHPHCWECKHVFKQGEIRYRYGSKTFHRECYKKWVQQETFKKA